VFEFGLVLIDVVEVFKQLARDLADPSRNIVER
jgi:hypothetical protein